MIAKISRGWGMGRLMRYLMGPGQANEHTGQRVIATWDGAPHLHQPPSNGSVCGFDVRGADRGPQRPGPGRRRAARTARRRQ